MAEEATNEYSRAVGSLAVHGAKSYEDLKPKELGDSVEDRRRKQFLGEFAPGYIAALDHVLDESQKLQPRSLKDRLLSGVLSKTGVDKKIWATAVDLVVREKAGPDAEKTLFEGINSLSDALPNAIHKWIDEGSVEDSLVPDLRRVEEGLKKGDKMLQTKIVVDAFRQTLDELNVNPRSQRDFISKIIANNIPGTGNIKAGSISPDTLQNLHDYGLVDYLPIHMCMSPEASSSGYGKAYKSNVVSDYEGRPKPDEVSPLPYTERLRNWQTEVQSYNAGRQAVIQLLNTFSQHYVDQGLFDSHYDMAWMRQNFKDIKERVSRVIDGEATSNILKFSEHPKVKSYERSDLGRGRADFAEALGSIKMVFEFAEKNNTLRSDETLQSAVFAFKNIMMGLYGIEEAKNR